MESSPMFLPVLVISSVVVALALFEAYHDVDDEFVGDWARSHELTLTADNRPMVSWYLRTARVLRTWGAIGGLVVPAFFALAWSGHLELVGVDTDGGMNPGDASWIFVGYLVGALYAEMALVRPVDPVRRSASLVPRDLEDYLPRRLLWSQRWLALAAVVGGLVAVAVPYDQDWTRPPSRNAMLGYAVFVIGFTVSLERLQRWIVKRPQPFTDASLVAADDAIRSQAVHSVAGAGLAVLLLMSAGMSLMLFSADVAVLRWTMWLPAVVCFVLALGACQRCGHRPWRVRRQSTHPAPVPA